MCAFRLSIFFFSFKFFLGSDSEVLVRLVHMRVLQSLVMENKEPYRTQSYSMRWSLPYDDFFLEVKFIAAADLLILRKRQT